MRVTPQCDTIETFQICAGDSVQSSPAVVYNGENHIVVWGDEKYSGKSLITAARVTPQGVVIDTGNFVGGSGDHYEYNPHLDFDGNRCLVAWFNHEAGDSICGRFINSSALPEDSILVISQIYSFFPLVPAPKIAFDNSNYFIVWHDKLPDSTNYDICGQFVSPSGGLVGTTVMIASDTCSQINPALAFDGVTYLVVWSEPSGIYGQRIAKDGQLIDSKFLISELTSYIRRTPCTDASSSNYLVVWSENRIDNDIYGTVDVPIGCEEDSKTEVKTVIHCWPTIFAGAWQLPEGKTCKVFDITGRIVVPGKLKPGIYFIEVDGKTIQKVVKIR